MSEISITEQIEFQLPPGGLWFYTQAPMLAIYRDCQTNDHSSSSSRVAPLAVAWDNTKSNGKGTKMYGVYTTMSRKLFMENLLDTPTESRHCYELLVEDMSCKGYADVEWEGAPDPHHSELSRLVKAIRSKVQETYSHEPKIYVCCGTRPTKEDPSIIKHSYHIVLDNIVFERNNDGQMKGFFTTIPGFTWMDGVEEKPMIDPRVYTKNRVLRLPHCTKPGSSVPFERISKDPLLDEFGGVDFGRDVDAVLPFFLCNPDISARPDCKFVPTPAVVLELAVTGNRKRRSRSSDPSSSSQSGDHHNASHRSNKILPVPLPIVQHLLHLAGDTVSKLGAVQYHPDKDEWQIQGDQRAQGRKCLIHPGTIHDSNNALLFVDKIESGFRVNYRCLASGCAKGRAPTIGYISMNSETFEWQIALSPPQQLNTIDEDRQEDDAVDMPDAAPAPTTANSSAEPQPQHRQQQDCDYEMVDDEEFALAERIYRDQMMDEDDEDQHDDRMDDGEEREPPLDIEIVEPPHDPENSALNTYEMVKARFEKKCFRLRSKGKFIKINDTPGDILIMSHTDVLNYYCDWFYFERLKEDGEMDKLPFIKRWITDLEKKSVEKIVVDPAGTEKDAYNLWRGFSAENLPSIPEDQVHDLVAPITKHFNDVVTSGVDDHTEFLHHYLANMVQRPWQKAQVALSLYGEQGCGKGIIFEFFRLKVLGSHCSYQTSRPEIDLFGRFASGAVNRVCIQVDEVKSLHDHADQLKDFITNPTVSYEQKCRDCIVVSNYANLILTSNNANALTVSTDDRRFALFHCKSVHKGNQQYFSELGAHLERPEVARAYYQYLMSMDLSPYPTSFQHKRPITTYYKEVQLNCIPVISRFFSGLVNSQHSETSVSFKDLYKKYENFHTQGNYKFLMTENSFGREVKKIDGVTPTRTSTCRKFQLDLERIKKHLKDINEYDPDAEY